MEDTATLDTGTAEAQSTETESAAPEASSAQAVESASPIDVPALLKRDKEDPDAVYSNAELDALEKHWDAEQKAKGQPKEKAIETKDEPDEAEGEKPEAKPEEKPEPEEDAEPEAEADESPEIKAILKEVGAKNLKEVPQKLKDLRKLVGGKDAQAVAAITKERDELRDSGKSLWTALRSQDPKAIKFAEENFGVKIASREAQRPAQGQQASGETYVDPKLFIDPESAELVNQAFRKMDDRYKQMESRFGTIEQDREKHVKATIHEKSMGSVVDEMNEIAGRIPELKDIPGFREVARGVLNGKADPRLKVFEELFEIAASIKGATLKDAYDIKRGRDSHRIEAVAKQQGRREAYEVKPNPSLSGIAGGKGENSYQPVTEADIERWSNDHNTHPKSWYDKEMNLLIDKVPKKARKIFDPA